MKASINSNLIVKVENYVKKELQDESTGHDWWHIQRVAKMAANIATREAQTDSLVIQLAALLHDVNDRKIFGEALGKESLKARNFLNGLNVTKKVVDHVCTIIDTLSFKGASVPTTMLSLEGQIVQDADRLDAIGAIGIARVFAFGGHRSQPLFDPEVTPVLHDSYEKYKQHQGSSINHFYEKLLLLKDRMNTQTAKKIAESRHAYLVGFLEQFYAEWEGER